MQDDSKASPTGLVAGETAEAADPFSSMTEAKSPQEEPPTSAHPLLPAVLAENVVRYKNPEQVLRERKAVHALLQPALDAVFDQFGYVLDSFCFIAPTFEGSIVEMRYDADPQAKKRLLFEALRAPDKPEAGVQYGKRYGRMMKAQAKKGKRK